MLTRFGELLGDDTVNRVDCAALTERWAGPPVFDGALEDQVMIKCDPNAAE
ncbi:hypothetical protein [Erythrobacter sp. JK5]|uniref:hypothetical protein n=1 Tax=Erythrobacter sp. JK5 TaxID=2829500 RepID=UPI001BA94FC1|nr:hypothetical protein [Erythrobacter sp. JK5]QUL37590.1 hypothetical protein KDC96_14780 [Erythrobacter sp. JK5]